MDRIAFIEIKPIDPGAFWLLVVLVIITLIIRLRRK